MREKLHLKCAFLQLPVGLEHHHEGLVDLVQLRAYSFGGAFGETLGEVSQLTGLYRLQTLLDGGAKPKPGSGRQQSSAHCQGLLQLLAAAAPVLAAASTDLRSLLLPCLPAKLCLFGVHAEVQPGPCSKLVPFMLC